MLLFNVNLHMQSSVRFLTSRNKTFISWICNSGHACLVWRERTLGWVGTNVLLEQNDIWNSQIQKTSIWHQDLKILVRNSKSWKIFTNIKMIGYVKLKLIFQCRKCKLKHWLLRKATKNGMNNEVVWLWFSNSLLLGPHTNYQQLAVAWLLNYS